MKTADIIGSIGVIILLTAFLLNLYKRITVDSRVYTLMNFTGAAICGFSSYLIHFYPFVLLEGVWAGFALVSFIRVPRGTLRK